VQSKGTADVVLGGKNGPRFKIASNVQGRNVEVVGLNIGEILTEVIGAVPLISKVTSSLKDINFDAFDVFNGQVMLTENLYDLEKIDLRGHHNSFTLQGSGKIRPQEASAIELAFAENGRVGKEIARATGTNVVPLKISGPGFSLKPDAGYTIGKLAGQMAKHKANDVSKKAVEILKGKGDKLLKGLFHH